MHAQASFTARVPPPLIARLLGMATVGVCLPEVVMLLDDVINNLSGNLWFEAGLSLAGWAIGLYWLFGGVRPLRWFIQREINRD